MTGLLTYREAAEYLGIGRDSLKYRTWTGDGPEPELDRALVNGQLQVVFIKEELDRWWSDLPDRTRRRLTRSTTEDRHMALQRKPRPQQAKKTPDPRAELVRALADSGTAVASACGTCGVSVGTDDPEAVQTTRQVGTYPYVRQVRSWRFHRVCHAASSGPELVAFVLDPTARPVRVTQAHADVARTLGVPLAYRELEKASSTDRGRGRNFFQHVPRAELAELRAAVEKRHRELTVPVLAPSGWPCSVCGRSHELIDAWGEYQGRPACGGCAKLIERAKIPRNRRLEETALDAARPHLPRRAIFALARDAADYRSLRADERRAPWAYCGGLPLAPLSDGERLAELEKRLAGVAG